MLPEMELLLDLERIDSELAELLAENGAIPPQIAKLGGRKAEAAASVEAGESDLDRLRTSREALDRTLEDAKRKLQDLLSKQLVIRTNEEYAALSHEIQAARAEISAIEDQILAVMEDLENATNALDSARRASADALHDIDARVAILQSELSTLADAVAVKRDERLRLATRVTPAILERYERILSSKGDSAMARVAEGACSGCYMTLPPQTVIEVRRSARLIECQGCGRILFWKPECDDG